MNGPRLRHENLDMAGFAVAYDPNPIPGSIVLAVTEGTYRLGELVPLPLAVLRVDLNYKETS